MSETYRVELLGFPGATPEDAAGLLAESFGLDEQMAESYIVEAPVAVRTGVDGTTARQYTHELLRIGASVRVVSEATGRAREFTHRDLAPVGETPPEHSPIPPPPTPEPTPRPAVRPQPAEATRSKTCPACGHRQAPAATCENCGYLFPHRPAQRAGGEPDAKAEPGGSSDLDVFESLRNSAERQAVREQRSREIEAVQKRAEKVAKRSSGNWHRSRAFIYGVVGLLIAATIVLLVLSPSDDGDTGDPVPANAPPPPPGFQFRRD